jgi:fructan beta-fructosidase
MDILCDKRFLNFPVRTGAPKHTFTLSVDGTPRRRFEVEIAPADAAFWANLDLQPFQGRTVHIDVDPPLPAAAELPLTDEPLGYDSLYVEGALEQGRRTARPAFHFTARRGWLNDPNGLVFYDGEYHLFFQHNPYGTEWGNMHWGHAVSADLVHWEEIGDALHMVEHAHGMCFSGSALVDEHDVTGFRTGPEKTLLAFFTDTGRGECLAYSNDRGRSWSLYEGNPVVAHTGRDPKVFWFDAPDAPGGGHWVMVLYDERDERTPQENCQDFIVLTSHDLKTWTTASRIKDLYECPDLVRLPVPAGAGERWVLYAADGRYMLGSFDGFTFTPDAADDARHTLWHGCFYAAQTYSNAPDGRCIQIGWSRGTRFGNLPFSQQMAVPVDLRLKHTRDGLRLCADPVPELESLRVRRSDLGSFELRDGEPRTQPLSDPDAAGYELQVDVALGGARRFELQLRGLSIVYDVDAQALIAGDVRASFAPADDRLRLHVFQDSGSLEIFAGDAQASGRAALIVADRPSLSDAAVRLTAHGGAATVHALTVFGLRGIWPTPGERRARA